jgi:hypothetical protein
MGIRNLCINMNNHQNAIFHQISDFRQILTNKINLRAFSCAFYAVNGDEFSFSHICVFLLFIAISLQEINNK